VFNSVSAFCNAGIDIIGSNSLCDYATHPIINLTTCLLIVLGGLGYIVWWDVLRILQTRTRRNNKVFRHLTLHSKIAITATFVLIFAGALVILLLEYNNPLSIGNMPLFDKVQVAFFQSVTTRTAGFASIPQENLTDAGAFTSLILMFVGGSPVGTAGGVKTVTVITLLCSALATIRGKKYASLFHRTVSVASIRKAVAVVSAFMAILLTSTILLAACTEASALDIIYESVSATATVGLSRNLTTKLNLWGKLVIIVTMYLGRVGPISLAVALGSKSESQNLVSDPPEEICIG
jgi:trk system potassium uptake protein TrkH